MIKNQFKKSFDNWDFNNAINISEDETQTHDNLIHLFINVLNFSKIDDYINKYISEMADMTGCKVDITLSLGKKELLLLEEFKRVTAKISASYLDCQKLKYMPNQRKIIFEFSRTLFLHNKQTLNFF